MHPASNGGSDGGLARFQSAPATWLEAFLESDDDMISIESPPILTMNQVESTNFVDPNLVLPVTLRQNSSPAEFLSQVDNYVNFTTQLSGDQSAFMDVETEKSLDDSVPFRVRAKRGFATHPRSIAERVRRTRISDRIRKLQELVPNMDKQTNTADMLQEAVEYVKFLQTQILELTEHQNKCTCSIKD